MEDTQAPGASQILAYINHRRATPESQVIRRMGPNIYEIFADTRYLLSRQSILTVPIATTFTHRIRRYKQPRPYFLIIPSHKFVSPLQVFVAVLIKNFMKH
jgi:hypothetical protein